MTKVIGLTGGIGSGKTTVANYFEEMGVPVYIADDGAKRVMQSKNILAEVKSAFGGNVFDDDILNRLENELNDYFKGNLKEFTIPLDLIGTDFQKKVWNELIKIPFGETRSYKEQSIAVGDLLAIRAVANANAKNKIAIVVPCHRVIGSDGTLTGYAGGKKRKKFLLELESKQLNLF